MGWNARHKGAEDKPECKWKLAHRALARAFITAPFRSAILRSRIVARRLKLSRMIVFAEYAGSCNTQVGPPSDQRSPAALLLNHPVDCEAVVEPFSADPLAGALNGNCSIRDVDRRVFRACICG